MQDSPHLPQNQPAHNYPQHKLKIPIGWVMTLSTYVFIYTVHCKNYLVKVSSHEVTELVSNCDW